MRIPQHAVIYQHPLAAAVFDHALRTIDPRDPATIEHFFTACNRDTIKRAIDQANRERAEMRAAGIAVEDQRYPWEVRQ